MLAGTQEWPSVSSQLQHFVQFKLRLQLSDFQAEGSKLLDVEFQGSKEKFWPEVQWGRLNQIQFLYDPLKPGSLLFI